MAIEDERMKTLISQWLDERRAAKALKAVMMHFLPQVDGFSKFLPNDKLKPDPRYPDLEALDFSGLQLPTTARQFPTPDDSSGTGVDALAVLIPDPRKNGNKLLLSDLIYSINITDFDAHPASEIPVNSVYRPMSDDDRLVLTAYARQQVEAAEMRNRGCSPSPWMDDR